MELYKNTNVKIQNKKPVEDFRLYEGGAHFKFDDMCRTLEKLLKLINNTTNKNKLTPIISNAKPFDKPVVNFKPQIKSNLKIGIENKKFKGGLNQNKGYLLSEPSAKSLTNKMVLPIININSLMNTAVTSRESIKFNNKIIAAKKPEMKFKDLVEFYTSSNDEIKQIKKSVSKFGSDLMKIKVKILF
jgi:hypothetical protein